MDIHQLETFLAVVEEGSFSGAAKALGRTQPAVSQVIGRLEDELGQRLFERPARRGGMTDAGKALVDAYCVNRDPATCPKLRADVLKVPHHGSAHFAPALFRAVAPTWAVTSAANRGTALCLPRAESSEALHSLGAHLISTSAEGSGAAVLTISARGDLRWQLPPQPIFAWQKPTARNKRATCGAPITYAQGQ